MVRRGAAPQSNVVKVKACIVRLKGGLGNQLFQYAFGRAFSLKHGSELLLETGLLNSVERGVTPRRYALAPYGITAKVLVDEVAKDHGVPRGRISKWLARRGVCKPGASYICESSFAYDGMRDLALRPTMIFEGYWQSERYFAGCRNVLEAELALSGSAETSRLLEEVQAADSVSVHFRRGDYVTNATASAHHGLCPIDYYLRSFEVIEGLLKNPRYFLFSDDSRWLEANKERLDRPVRVVSREDGFLPHEELKIMSNCRHHILANSSFSWWGAWLNERPDTLVIAPKNWFRQPISTADLLPARWRKL